MDLLPFEIHQEKTKFEKPSFDVLFISCAYKKNYDLKLTAVEIEQTNEQLLFKLKKNIVSTVSVSRFGVSIKMSPRLRESFCFIHTGKTWYFIVASTFLEVQIRACQSRTNCVWANVLSEKLKFRIEIARVYLSCIMRPSGPEFYGRGNFGCWQIPRGSDGRVNAKYSMRPIYRRFSAREEWSNKFAKCATAAKEM